MPAWGRRADFAIDLGTANTLVVAGTGVVFDQPSICCFDDDLNRAGKLYAAGDAAKSVLGREVRSLRSVRPLRNGVLVDVAATRELIRFAARPVMSRRRLRRPRAIIGVPTDATQAERRGLTRAAYDAGLAEPLLLAEPLVSAVGAGIDIHAARGRMIVDCGAGITDVVVVSLGGICAAQSVRGGGDAVDTALLHHLHLKRHFHIGASSAERLKLALSTALAAGTPSTVEVKGLDTTTGLPRVLELGVGEVRHVIDRYVSEVVTAVRRAFAQTAPDLAQDIFENGILLTGGAAMTALLAERIEQSTGIAARCVDEPERTLAKGLHALLETPRA